MSIEIKYNHEDRPIVGVKLPCEGDSRDYLMAEIDEDGDLRLVPVLFVTGTGGSIYPSLDDAEAFFKAGLKLVEQQRRAK